MRAAAARARAPAPPPTASFGQLGIDELISLIDPPNARSIAVATRLGMPHTDRVIDPESATEVAVHALSRPPAPVSAAPGGHDETPAP